MTTMIIKLQQLLSSKHTLTLRPPQSQTGERSACYVMEVSGCLWLMGRTLFLTLTQGSLMQYFTRGEHFVLFNTHCTVWGACSCSSISYMRKLEIFNLASHCRKLFEVNHTIKTLCWGRLCRFIVVCELINYAFLTVHYIMWLSKWFKFKWLIIEWRKFVWSSGIYSNVWLKWPHMHV